VSDREKVHKGGVGGGVGRKGGGGGGGALHALPKGRGGGARGKRFFRKGSAGEIAD